MKKLFLAGALALFAGLNAQTEKGAWVVGGKTGLGFNSVSTKIKSGSQSADGPKTSTFSITPSVGYFVMNDLALGIDLTYASKTSKYKASATSAEIKETDSNFGILPNLTYYFPTGSEFRPYLGAGIGYGNATSQNPLAAGRQTTKGGLLWGAKGGFVYLLNSSIGLDLGVGYSQFSASETIASQKLTTKAGGLGVNAGISVFFK